MEIKIYRVDGNTEQERWVSAEQVERMLADIPFAGEQLDIYIPARALTGEINPKESYTRLQTIEFLEADCFIFKIKEYWLTIRMDPSYALYGGIQPVRLVEEKEEPVDGEFYVCLLPYELFRPFRKKFLAGYEPIVAEVEREKKKKREIEKNLVGFRFKFTDGSYFGLCVALDWFRVEYENRLPVKRSKYTGDEIQGVADYLKAKDPQYAISYKPSLWERKKALQKH